VVSPRVRSYRRDPGDFGEALKIMKPLKKFRSGFENDLPFMPEKCDIGSELNLKTSVIIHFL
jgi:hypothetical protein